MSGAVAVPENPPETQTPHLSFSRLNRYLHCPEQYRLYYIERLRPRSTPANLVFGQAVHQALARLLQSGEDPVGAFTESWEALRDADLAYNTKESWEGLHQTGRGLVEKFRDEELPKIAAVHAVEQKFSLDVTSLDLPFVGVIDLVADLDGKRTVVDFKTAAKAYQAHEVMLSDQLTAYQLADPQAEQMAFCVLVKTKRPRIDWHFGRRLPAELGEYLRKARIVAHEITAGQFYKRPGLWCSWCDFLPVCTGDSEKARETLIQIR